MGRVRSNREEPMWRARQARDPDNQAWTIPHSQNRRGDAPRNVSHDRSRATGFPSRSKCVRHRLDWRLNRMIAEIAADANTTMIP
jgi:hypothetical protein